MKHVVITGVSSGIGYDASLKLAERGFYIFGSIRREHDAEPLRQALGHRFTPLLFDVTDADAIGSAASLVKEHIGSDGLAGLINNAGFAVNGPLMHMPLRDLEKQFDVNVFGVYRVTQAFLPLLGAIRNRTQPPGRIINISSTSGRLVFPFIAAYAASKHAVEALSDGFRRELSIYGIHVIVIEPGVVNTPIWDKKEDVSPYRDTDYGPYHQPFLQSAEEVKQSGLSVEAVSRVICRAMLSQTPRTRYVVMSGGLQGRLRWWWAPRLLGDKWLDRRLRKAWGLTPWPH